MLTSLALAMALQTGQPRAAMVAPSPAAATVASATAQLRARPAVGARPANAATIATPAIRALAQPGANVPDALRGAFARTLAARLTGRQGRQAERDAVAAELRSAEQASLAARNAETALWFANLSAACQPDLSARAQALTRAQSLALANGLTGSRTAGEVRAAAAALAIQLNLRGNSAAAETLLSAMLAEGDAAASAIPAGPGPGTRAELLLRRAETLALLGNGPASDADWDIVEALTRAATGNTGRDLANLLNQRAFSLNQQDRFAEAEAKARVASAMFETAAGAQDIDTQRARYNLAVALLGLGRARDALPLLTGALAVMEQSAAAQDRDIAMLQTAIARARLATGSVTEARTAADEATVIARRLRTLRLSSTGGGGGDAFSTALSRAGTGSERRQPLSPAFDVAMLTAWEGRARDATAMDTAFRAAQELTLTDAGEAINLSAARDLAGGGELGTLARERQDISRSYMAAQRALRQAAGGNDSAATTRARASRDALLTRLTGIDQRIAEQFPGYAALVAPGSVSIAEVQRTLAEDQGLVMLLASEGHQYVFALSRTRARWHRIDGGEAAIAAMVARLRCRIDEASCSVADYDAAMAAQANGPASPIDEVYPRFDRGTAFTLYRQLLAPVEDALPANGRIFIIANGPVATLPLATLVTADPGARAESGDAADLAATPWLADRYAFITLASVSALMQGERISRRNQPGALPPRSDGAPAGPGRRGGGVGGRGTGGGQPGGGQPGGGQPGGAAPPAGGGPGRGGMALYADTATLVQDDRPRRRRPAGRGPLGRADRQGTPPAETATTPTPAPTPTPRPSATPNPAMRGGVNGRLVLLGYGAPALVGSGGSPDAASRGTRQRGGVRAIVTLPVAPVALGGGDNDMAETADDSVLADPALLRSLDPLPGTASELQGLAAGATGTSRIYTGSEATETRLKTDPDLAAARTIVFATHGLLPGEMGPGSEPGLVLTPPAEASDTDDGLLTAAEVANLDINARYVMLSACNTATAHGGGESLSALARSFLYAGAETLVASHWRVSDDATAALMIETQGGPMATPARALQAAMRAVRTGRRADGSPVAGYQSYWAHPAAWAPFTLITNRDL